jgi:hypothetical protein
MSFGTSAAPVLRTQIHGAITSASPAGVRRCCCSSTQLPVRSLFMLQCLKHYLCLPAPPHARCNLHFARVCMCGGALQCMRFTNAITA